MCAESYVRILKGASAFYQYVLLYQSSERETIYYWGFDFSNSLNKIKQRGMKTFCDLTKNQLKPSK